MGSQRQLRLQIRKENRSNMHHRSGGNRAVFEDVPLAQEKEITSLSLVEVNQIGFQESLLWENKINS